MYCAGGTTGTVRGTTHGYVYDPVAGAWSAIASLPVDLWGMAYGAADGQLLISGGVTAGGTELTNQGFAYTPGTGWSALPGSPDALYRSGSGCGLYEIGGYDASSVPTSPTQVLPRYNDCASGSRVPWLTVSPTVTVPPGKSVTVSVSLNAGDKSVTQPGTYTASLVVVNNTPYRINGDPVAVSMTVTPPSRWGEVGGTVTGLACDGTSTPLPGAAVTVTGKTATWTLTTDSGGGYALWADQGQNPLTVIAQASGWQAQTATATITAGKAATANLTLTPSGGCVAGARHA